MIPKFLMVKWVAMFHGGTTTMVLCWLKHVAVKTIPSLPGSSLPTSPASSSPRRLSAQAPEQWPPKTWNGWSNSKERCRKVRVLTINWNGLKWDVSACFFDGNSNQVTEFWWRWTIRFLGLKHQDVKTLTPPSPWGPPQHGFQVGRDTFHLFCCMKYRHRY